MSLPDGPDYFNEDGVHNPPGYGETAGRSAKPVVFLGVGLLLVALIIAGAMFLNRGEDETPARAPVAAPSPAPSSKGITQEQLDSLGASIAARYASGDTEIAQALLDNFMAAHPECVSAVMAGGEGRMRDVLAQSEEVAEQLRDTAPHPEVYTTVITVKDNGVVKAAVLGVSCEESA